MPVPIAWTPDDVKIILRTVNPTDCGAGGGDTFLFSTIPSIGGDMTGLSRSPETVFYAGYSKAVFVTSSTLSPVVCGPGGESNQGKIVFWDLENNRQLERIEVPNSDYSLGKVLIDESMIEYFRRPAVDNNGCADIDYSLQGDRLVSSLP
jgi:hypothetical protein